MLSVSSLIMLASVVVVVVELLTVGRISVSSSSLCFCLVLVLGRGLLLLPPPAVGTNLTLSVVVILISVGGLLVVATLPRVLGLNVGTNLSLSVVVVTTAAGLLDSVTGFTSSSFIAVSCFLFFGRSFSLDTGFLVFGALVVLVVLLPLAGTNLTRSVVVIRTSLTGDLVLGLFFGLRVGTNLTLSVVEMTMDFGWTSDTLAAAAALSAGNEPFSSVMVSSG